MAGITALNKIKRQQAAFGGVMGKDGRKAYVGGSYSTKGTTGGKERGSYQGRDDKGGYGGTYSGGGDGPKDRSNATQQRNHQAAINRAQGINVPKEKKKINLNIPSFKDMYDGYNKFRYNTVNSLIPGQKERIQKYRTAYAKYLKDQGVQVPGNLLDEDLSSYFFDGAFDKNVNFEGASGKGINTPYMDYGSFMATKMGSPGIKYAGNVGGLGDKYVTKRGPDGRPLEYGYTNIDEGGNLILGRGEGGGQNYLPLNYGVGGGDEEEETQTFEFDSSRFGPGGDAADVTRASYIFNQGGRVPRNMGGIMNAVPRQGYFLGKIVKGVGKAIGSVADAAGKVLKSDLGKAALAGAAFYYGGGGGNPFTAAGRDKFSIGNFFSKSNPLLFTDKKFNPLKLAGLVTLGGAAMGPAKQDPSLMTDRGGKMPDFLTGGTGTPAELRANIRSAVEEAQGDPVKLAAIDEKYNYMLNLGLPDNLPYPNYAVFASGGRVPAQEGGLMNLGGMEKDYRNEGGFVPIGKQEKADDVPARLSVNEFVFTADAVRNAGGGDIDKGAEVMENMMKNLENGGRISEESQGNTGAQEMFSVSERIGEVI